MFHVLRKQTLAGWCWVTSYVNIDDAIYNAEQLAFTSQEDCSVKTLGHTIYYVTAEHAYRMIHDLHDWTKEGF